MKAVTCAQPAVVPLAHCCWGGFGEHRHSFTRYEGAQVLGKPAVTCVVYRVLPIKATIFVYSDSLCNDPTAQYMLEDLERII